MLLAPQFSAYTMDLYKVACVLSSHRSSVKIHELHDVLIYWPNMPQITPWDKESSILSSLWKTDTIQSLKVHIKQGKGNKILLSQEMSPIRHIDAGRGPVLKDSTETTAL